MSDYMRDRYILNDKVISFVRWVQAHQSSIDCPIKRRHLSCVISHANLVERQIQLGRSIPSPNAVPKVGN